MLRGARGSPACASLSIASAQVRVAVRSVPLLWYGRGIGGLGLSRWLVHPCVFSLSSPRFRFDFRSPPRSLGWRDFGVDLSRSVHSSRRGGWVGGVFVSVAGAPFARGPAVSPVAARRRCPERHGGGSQARFTVCFSLFSTACFRAGLSRVKVSSRRRFEFINEASTPSATLSVPPSAVAPSASASQV